MSSRLTQEARDKNYRRSTNPTANDFAKANAECSFFSVGTTDNGNIRTKNTSVGSVSRSLAWKQEKGGPSRDLVFYFIDQGRRIAGTDKDVKQTLSNLGLRFDPNLALDINSFSNSSGTLAHQEYERLLRDFQQKKCDAVVTKWTLEDLLILAQFKGSASVTNDEVRINNAQARAALLFGRKRAWDFVQSSVEYYKSSGGYVLATLADGKKRSMRNTGKGGARLTTESFFAEANRGSEQFYIVIARSGSEANAERPIWESLQSKYGVGPGYDDLLAQMAEYKRKHNVKEGKKKKAGAVPYLHGSSSYGSLSGRKGAAAAEFSSGRSSGSERSGGTMSYQPVQTRVPPAVISRAPPQQQPSVVALGEGPSEALPRAGSRQSPSGAQGSAPAQATVGPRSRGNSRVSPA